MLSHSLTCPLHSHVEYAFAGYHSGVALLTYQTRTWLYFLCASRYFLLCLPYKFSNNISWFSMPLRTNIVFYLRALLSLLLNQNS